MGKVLKVREVGDPILSTNGIVFLEKVSNPNGFATREMINKFNLKEENDNRKIK